MYTSFFGLNEKPFTITPDPRYLFMSERHGEGLAHLVYGVTEGGGFIQLTGEVGTGKTTLVRTLLGQIPAEVDIALILNPQLSAVEFLLAICEELGIPGPADKNSSKELVDALNRHLLESHSRGRRIILLIDEAQNLSEGVLEQLRLLTNLETARQKLLQIILIAQPELREKLAQDSLRQLAQRITGRYHLEPLSREEASKYIDHRLRVAGALTEIFTPAAKREVFRLSGGVPRIMNVVCDRALLGAYSRETRIVDNDLVREAASEVAGQKSSPQFFKWLLPALGFAAAALVIALLWAALGGDQATPEVSGAALPLDETLPPATTLAVLDTDARSGQTDDAAESAEIVFIATPDLDRLLQDHVDSDAFQAVFELWNLGYDSARGTACDQAAASGLRCYFQRGTWATLRQLDRPAIITLTGDDGTSWQVALTGLDENNAQIIVRDEVVSLPIAALSDHWFGQFILLWRPPYAGDEQIGPGASSDSVIWLRESLASLNSALQMSPDEPATFDNELTAQLQEFQREHRLSADGVAGLKTQIIINSLLEPEGFPRLSTVR